MTETKTASPVTSIAALRELLVESRKELLEIKPKPLSRVADRKLAIKTQLENFELDGLKAKLTGYIDLITTFQGDEVILNEHFAELVMAQKLATRDIKELVDVVEKAIKTVVFDSMNAKNAEDPKIEDPVNVNAKIPVPSMALEFSREGAGVDVVANVPALKKVLEGAGISWTSVFNTETQVVYTLNEDALWNAIKDDVDLKEEVFGVIEEVPKGARLNVRPITVDPDEI